MALTTRVLGVKTRRNSYIVVVEVSGGPDGTATANEITRFTGPGLGTETDLEATRQLTAAEQAAVLDATSRVDIAQLPQLKRLTRYSVIHRC